jgi:hypothetical protein
MSSPYFFFLTIVQQQCSYTESKRERERERRRRQNVCSLIGPSYKVRNRFSSDVCMSSILINRLKV